MRLGRVSRSASSSFGHEAFCSFKQQAFLLHANRRRHSQDKFYEAVIEEHRPDFEAVRHAHGVQVAQQARLKMRFDVHVGKPLQQAAVLHPRGPVAQVALGFTGPAAIGQGRRQKPVQITFQEEHLDRQLRGHKRVAAEQVGHLAPAKRQILPVEQK